MSEKIVNIAASQKVTANDLTNIGRFARAGVDHLALDGVTGGTRGYVGFNAVKTAQTKVTVGAGRLHGADGAVYFNDSTAGKELDFLSALPAVAKRIAAVVVFGAAGDTQSQGREFLINSETGQTEARAAATENWRTADVGFQLGFENATPQPPAVDPQYLVVAYVTLTPTAVESVTMNEDTRLRSARDAYLKALGTENLVTAFEPKLVSIENDVAGVKIDVNSKLDSRLGYVMAFDVAALKKRVGLPAEYIDYDSDDFLNASKTSDTDLANGHAAKVMEGLRFPPANTAIINGLALLNQNEASVAKDPSGLILPKYNETRFRVVAGNSGELALNSIAYDTNSILNATMSRTRARFGPEFVANSDWFTGAKNTGNGIDATRMFFLKNGETYQSFVEENPKNPDGTVQVRLRKSWLDTVSTPYWTFGDKTPQALYGFKYAQTFLNARDQWVTSLGINFTRLDTSGGQCTLLLCECFEDGRPNDQKVLTQVSALPNQLRAGIYTKLPCTPTFIEKGKMYALMIVSAANHYVAVGDSSQGGNGSLFFKNGAGYWQTDPGKNMLVEFWYGTFERNRTEVQLQTLTLAGGITSLDILAQAIVPSSANLVYEVQVAGNWIPLTADNVANQPFASLPDTLPFRVVFVGGGTVQPGLILPSSQVILSRPAPNLKHFSKRRTLPTATKFVRTKTRIENFDANKHNVVPKLKPAGGAELEASLVTDQDMGGKVVERTAFFTLPTAGTQFQRITQANTTDVNDPCVITEVGDVATSS